MKALMTLHSFGDTVHGAPRRRVESSPTAAPQAVAFTDPGLAPQTADIDRRVFLQDISGGARRDLSGSLGKLRASLSARAFVVLPEVGSCLLMVV